MKIAVFCYSQTGQALTAANHLFEGVEGGDICVVCKPIVPLMHYPFPWDKYEFFDTMPETRLGLPPSGIEPIDFCDVEDAELVVIVGQSWYLSPSLPLQSFFADENVRGYLQGRDIVFMNVCRNMWLMTIRWMKDYVKAIGARLVGHIVLQDKTPNLVSATTIVRWLLHGKKGASGVLPEAGVADSDLHGVSRFGAIIAQAVGTGEQSQLQPRLLEAGAISYSPSILHIEQVGHRMFAHWARFIRKKGGFRDVRRKNRVWLFYYYLLVALFTVSPFVQLFFYLTYPLRGIGKKKAVDCSV